MTAEMRVRYVSTGIAGDVPVCWYCGAPVIAREADHVEGCMHDWIESLARAHREELHGTHRKAGEA